MDVQLATAVGATDTALLETTIDENFRATVAAHGDREALVVRHQGIRWTYDELDTRVDELARALLAAGGDQTRARRLANDARAVYRVIDSARARREDARLTGWLAKHGLE